MLKRVKRAFNVLLGKDILSLEEYKKIAGIEGEISPESLREILGEPLGDGKAEFLPDMTEDEYQQYVRDEEQGWGAWRKRMGL